MKIKIDSAPEKVVKHILSEIKSGKLKSGDKLPTHQELAELYGVGRSSIREAINALVVMNFIISKQGKGTFVKETIQDPTPTLSVKEDIFESATLYNLMEIREVLECHAVRKAAKVISEEQIKKLEDAYERLKKSYEKVNLYLEEDINFHMEIAISAKNSDLGEMLKIIHHKVNKKTPVILKTASKDSLKKAINTARDIVKFIKAGDGYRAERIMREHLGIAREEFLKILFEDRDSSFLTF